MQLYFFFKIIKEETYKRKLNVCIDVKIDVLSIYLHITHYYRDWQIKLKTLGYHNFFG